MVKRSLCLLAFWLVVPARLVFAAEVKAPVDFARDIKPIFEARCQKCHGAEKKSGQLRLDVKALAMAGGVSGAVILPGQSQSSPLVKLLLSADPEERMPRKADPLPRGQIDLIRAWIDQGAVWPAGAVGSPDETVAKHWAYVPPRRPALPPVKRAGWARSPLDMLVLARLEQEGLGPSPEASRETQIRRLSLDLTGLPPTLKDVDDFVHDRSPNAYDKVVERVLASPHYGERWARLWLDLARYADSHGYDSDGARVMWKFRDWVIRAFNQDMPYSQFTIEQLAGDMLENATIEQQIASGFHANTLLNEEGGVDGGEARYDVLVDRVNTTSSVWLGSTLGCAQCHNHKYDPFSQRDYFGMLAFFDNIDVRVDMREEYEGLMYDPQIRVPSATQSARLRELEDGLQAIRGVLATQTPELDAAEAMWSRETRSLLDTWRTVAVKQAKTAHGASFQPQKDGSLLVVGPNPVKDDYTLVVRPAQQGAVTGLRLEVLADPGLPASGPGRGPTGGFVLSEFKVETASRGGTGAFTPAKVAKVEADGTVFAGTAASAIDGNDETGWSVRPGGSHTAIFELAEPIAGDVALRITLEHRSLHRQHGLGRFRLAASGMSDPPRILKIPARVRAILLTAPGARKPEERAELSAYHRSIAPLLQPARDRLAALEKQVKDLSVPTAMVMKERPSFERPSTLLRIRGSYASPGERIYARVPVVLPPLKDSMPSNRLGLARWLVDRDNPLTARVAVNRIWEQYFGKGLVETSEDFGRQGSKPSHPELLDWLAVELMERGWSLKAFHRLVVGSATYRQSSHVTPQLLEKDPQNRLLARGGRFRVEAETLRDIMLGASGLLSPRIGGPSVFPIQPDGIWNVSRSSLVWNTSVGEDRYRRGIYTFLRRSAPYPMLTTFDGTSREVCALRRIRTNTPLQALNLLNDPVAIESAQALARRITREAPANPRARAALGFRLCVARAPSAKEVDDLVALQERARAWLAGKRGAAAEVLQKPEAATNAKNLFKGQGEGEESQPSSPDRDSSRAPAAADNPELAAWTMVANVLLNLDETQTRE